MPNEIEDRTRSAAGRSAPLDRVIPGPSQESVWDYPRIPRLEPVTEWIRVVMDGLTVAATDHGWRVLETGGAPVYYVPPEDVRHDVLRPNPHRSACEWKGEARYHTLRIGDRVVEDVAWSYADPKAGFEPIRDHLAFYAGRVDEAWLGDKRATPQPGNFYGGWVTSRIVGPFKSPPTLLGWVEGQVRKVLKERRP